MGKSGSGKSTLLNILGTLDKPTSGEYLFKNQNPFSLKDSELSRFRGKTIGFIFQQFYLQPFLTVAENIAVSLYFQGFSKEKIKPLIEDILSQLDLLDRINFLPSQLSGGQMQRVAIARSVVTSPKLVLADEPTGNLDSKNGNEVINILKNIVKNQKRTVLIVTHDKEIANMCDNTFYLNDGYLQY